jgi:flagellar motor switch protein FliM
MSEVLSQDEIDQLLSAINAGDTEPEDFRPAIGSRNFDVRHLCVSFSKILLDNNIKTMDY